jgi:hypothetical protein
VTDEQRQAIEDVRATFPEHAADTEELDDGAVWVVLREVEIGSGWSQPVIDVAVKLLVTFPSTPPYPFYGPAGLHRTDGSTFNPLQPSVDVGDGVLRAQISLTKAFDAARETLGSRFVAVLGWLRNPR